MRTSVAAGLFFALGLLRPVRMSFPADPEDMAGSGHDLEGSASGSGDWSGQDKVVWPVSNDQVSESTQWPPIDFKSEFIVVGNRKSFLENQQIISGLIAGGVTGVILAALLAALLVYKWQMKHKEGFIQGQRVDRE